MKSLHFTYAACIATTLLTAVCPQATDAGAGDVPEQPDREGILDSANPDLIGGCGIDVALVLDASGSIEKAGAKGVVVGAAQAYVDALRDSGSRVAVVNFNSRAGVAASYGPVTESSAAPGGSHWMAIHDGAPNGYQLMSATTTGVKTNWESALAAVAALGAPDLVVLITDGVPTAWLDDAGRAVDAPDTELGVRDARLQAQPAAGALRAGGSHILGVAVGALSAAVTPANHRDDPPFALTQLTDLLEPGPGLGFYFPGAIGEADSFEVASDDVVIVQDFGVLGARLRELATSVCAVPAAEPQPALPPPLPKTGTADTAVLATLGAAITASGVALVRLGKREK